MRTRSILSLLVITAATLTFTFNTAEAGFPAPPGILIPPGLPGSSVNVRINGYVPAPPGVNVQIDAGRSYYVESDRRIYIEKEKPKHKHHKKHKKHHDDQGNHYGHDKHEGHGGRGGHGR